MKKFMGNSEKNQRKEINSQENSQESLFLLDMEFTFVQCHIQTFSSLLINKEGALRLMCLRGIFFHGETEESQTLCWKGPAFWNRSREERPEKVKALSRGMENGGKNSKRNNTQNTKLKGLMGDLTGNVKQHFKPYSLFWIHNNFFWK